MGPQKRQYQNPFLTNNQEAQSQAHSQVMDPKIDFYNKGLTGAQHSSPGLRTAAGPSGANAHSESADGFQYQQEHIQQYGQPMQQRPGQGKDVGYGGLDHELSDEDDGVRRVYPAAEPVGKGAQLGGQGPGGNNRRAGGMTQGQFHDFQGGAKRADEEMDIEPMLGGNQQQHNQLEGPMGALKSQKQATSYAKIHKMMKSHNWSQRAQALEDFLRYLIEMQPSELMNEFNNEKEFSPLVDQIIIKLDMETVIKIIEISLDLIELLLSSLPECLIQNIDQVLVCFLKQLGNRREIISDKANDLINLARETLGADFLLPHFVTILNGMASDVTQLKTKISALDVMNVLIRESDSLQESQEETYIQYAAVIKTLGNVLKLHSSQRAVVQPIVGAIQALRDKNDEITFKAIYEELSHTQYVILKQMLNQHDKVLARQLADFQAQQNQPMEGAGGHEDSSQGYTN